MEGYYNYHQVLWQSMLGNCQLDDRWIFVLGTFSINIILFWLHNAFLYCLYTCQFMKKYQIQPDGKIDQPLVWENIRETIVNQCIGVPLASYLLYQPFTYFGMQIRTPIPTWTIICRDLLVAVIVTDTIGYWGHRTLHHKSIYKYFHKHHHRYKVNVGIAAVFAHPVEDIFNNTLSSVSGCMFMGSHVFVFWLWLAIRQTEAINAHSGYHILPHYISKWFSGGRFHEFHHSHNVGNYGAFTTIWDYIMGTDVAFEEYETKRQTAESVIVSKSIKKE